MFISIHHNQGSPIGGCQKDAKLAVGDDLEKIDLEHQMWSSIRE